MDALQYITLGVAPGLFWVWFFWRKDDLEPEPMHLVLWVFVLGCVSVLGVTALRPVLEGLKPATTTGWAHELVDVFLVTVPLEEGLKLCAFLAGIAWHRELDEPMDGIVYGAVAGLGFASVENVLYLEQLHWTGEAEPSHLAVMRGFTSTLLHASTTAILGFLIGLHRLGAPVPAWLLWGGGWTLTWGFHGLYSYGLVTEGVMSLVALLGVLPALLVVLAMAIRWARSVRPWLGFGVVEDLDPEIEMDSDPGRGRS